MAQTTLILAISIAFTAIQFELTESRLNQLPRNVFQIRTTETPLAASRGNNLNAARLSFDEDFQAISPASFDGESKKSDEENVKSNSNQGNVKESHDSLDPQRYVWDDCLGRTYREQRHLTKTKDEAETAVDYRIYQPNDETRAKYVAPLIWTKRNNVISKTNESSIVTDWIERYKNLLKAKAEEQRAQKQDPIFPRENKDTTTQPSISLTNLVLSLTKTQSASTASDNEIILSSIPTFFITKDLFEESTVPTVTQNVVARTDSNVIASYTEDWLDFRNKTKIRFSSLPRRDTYLVPTLRLDEGFYPFSFMSEFFYLIYSFDFPVGLVKDIVWGEFSFPYSFIHSIKVESTFFAFIILFACIALVLPVYLLVLGVLALLSNSDCNYEVETGALFPEAEESDCNDRGLAVATMFVIIVCCVLITGMAVSNEQAYEAASSARNVMNCVLADLATWVTTAARELHHSLIPPMDLVLHAYKKDLNNVDMLLGEPIQQSIASESGIDLVFDSLADIIAESEEISLKVAALREVCIKAESIATVTSNRIRDLASQLDTLKQHCSAKDMPLCDTVNSNSLEMKMKFDSILREQQLLQLKTLGEENLTKAISNARKEFRALPAVVYNQTVKIRQKIYNDIEARRQSVVSSSRVLNDMVRHLSSGLHTTSRRFDSVLGRVETYEFGRWALMLSHIVIFGFVMALILMALLCGCGHAKNHAQRTLKVSAGWLCFASLLLWGLISTIFLMTGHAEVYVCHALWDSPQYKTLSALLDRPSPLLTEYEGIFDAIFRDMDNVTVDVNIKDVLRDCEKDQPAYLVFQLDKILDVNKETSYFEWEELQVNLGKLPEVVDVGLLKTISGNFSLLLNKMRKVTDVDLAKYRMDFNVPVVGRDLPSLVDQLQNIAAQMSDLSVASRLETLASRTQRLHTANIKPLELIRADIVFKLTELELQLMPFRRKLNISLSHIHTAQFYIDNQGDVIARKKISIFISRLVSHAAGWRTHVLKSVAQHAGRCRPLYNVFAGVRRLLCTNYISSMHGWWVCGFCLGVLWCTALMPLCVRLWRTYGRKLRAQEAMSLTNLSGQQETPTTALCDSSNWNTPGIPPPPPRSDSW